MKDFKEIVSKFQVEDTYVTARPLGNGAINDTYEIICEQDHYVLQEINRTVFKHPADVMNNLFLVTEHLKQKILEEGGDPRRETLEYIRTREGNTMLQTEQKSYYRMYRMIQNAEAMERMKTVECAEHAAAAYGKFQKRLADFDSSKLSATIPRYHDTKYQLKKLLSAIRADVCARASGCQQQIMFVLDRSEQLGTIIDEMKSGQIPWRVTHNDTKCSNILMEKETKQAVCVIDLDTVMPGCALYDYGDAIRSEASPAGTDVTDDSPELNMDMFEAYTKGYLSEMRDSLSVREKELMVYSVWLMTMECGIRYLTDYLSGDVYFRHGDCEKTNLKKAVQQFCLVLDIEEKKELMEEIVRKYLS